MNKKVVLITLCHLYAQLVSAPFDILQTGSFGIINNTTASSAWLAPNNKQFSFYRVYPNCVKDQTPLTCRQNINWKNDLREYYYNGDYVTFAALDDAKILPNTSSSNVVTVTLAPLLQEQLQNENPNITVVCDKKAQTVTVTSYAVTYEGQKAVTSWQISFDVILSNLYQLVVGAKILDTMSLEATSNATMKILHWYLNCTFKDTPEEYKSYDIADISIDLVVLSNTKKEDAFTLFFTASNADLVKISALRKIV